MLSGLRDTRCIRRRSVTTHSVDGRVRCVMTLDYNKEDINVDGSVDAVAEHIAFVGGTRRKVRWYSPEIGRWVLQAALCAGIMSLLVVVDSLNTLFQGSGYWALQSAVMVIEATTGASLKKSFERICGTVVGGFVSFAFFLLVTWNETATETLVSQILLLLFVCVWPLPWGYVRARFPKNPLIATYGTFTGYIVVIPSFVKGNAFRVVIVRTSAVALGVLISTGVVHCVWPNSARKTLDERIAELMRRMADVLDPLVEFEAGLLQTGKICDHVGKGRATLQSIANQRCQLKRQKALAAQARVKVHGCCSATSLNELAREQQEHNQRIAAAAAEAVAGNLNQQESTSPRHLYTVSSSTSVSSSGISQSGGMPPFPISSLSEILVTLDSKDSVKNRYFSSAAMSSVDVSPRPSVAAVTNPAVQKLSVDADQLCRRIANRGGRGSMTDDEQSLSCTLSSVSELSTFFREQDSALEGLYSQALTDVVSVYEKALHVDAATQKQRCGIAYEHLCACQVLMKELPVLVTGAKQELSWRKGFSVFPEKKYKELISHVECLFHYIASLFFSIDLQLMQISEARHKSFSVAVNAAAKCTGCPVFLLAARHSNVCDKPNPELARKLFAGISAAFIFTDAFGKLVRGILETSHTALTLLANALLTHTDTAEAREAMECAAAQIDALHRLRSERHSIYSSIFTAAADADAMNCWTETKRSCFRNDANVKHYTSLPWDTLMGIEAETFRSMTKAEHEVYWDSYWLARDRLSVAMGTLMLLRDQLYFLCKVIEEINQKSNINGSAT